MDATTTTVVRGDLGATRSKQRRPFEWDAAEWVLTYVAGKRSKSYAVKEFPVDRDFEGRAFEFTDLATGERRDVFYGRTGKTCDCEAGSYEPHSSACRSEWHAGTEVQLRSRATVQGHEFAYDRHECRHLDAVCVLMEFGLFDGRVETVGIGYDVFAA